MDDDCVFCKIVAGEIPAALVHEDEGHLAFDDMNPHAEHHVLVIPREHHANLDTYIAGGTDPRAMLEFVAATAQKRGIAGGYRLITNVGPAANQTVPHLHWHVLAGAGLPGFK